MSALPILGALGGGILGIFGASSHNKQVEAQRRRAIQSTKVQASEEKDRNVRRTAENVGLVAASFGDRGVFGKSSKAAILTRLADGARGESAINLDTYFRIANINTQAANSEQSVFGAALSGGLSGFQLGSNLSDFISAGGLDFLKGSNQPLFTSHPQRLGG